MFAVLSVQLVEIVVSMEKKLLVYLDIPLRKY